MTTRKDDIEHALLEGLTDPQRQAVRHGDGPLLILAGPGSGKTRVVTRRAAFLAATVTKPWHVLAITFTNKAAREMVERIAALGTGEGMTVGTFHAFCAKLLRWHAERAGVARNFTIVDRDDRRKILTSAVRRSGLSTDNYPPRIAEHIISRAKSDLRTAADFARVETDWQQKTYARIYTQYEQLLHDMNALDFDDLLMKVVTMLQRDSELRGELQDRYRYILIDEYQDTNAAQYAIANLLAGGRHNLCATGDPDQSIYGWRGANIENILAFERDHPHTQVVRLEQNFRSTQRILSAADALIAINTRRKEKALWSELEHGIPVRMVECEDGSVEAGWVAKDIAARVREGIPPADVAVFYRVNAMSRGIEEALLRHGIAYQVARGVEFYSRKEIKDVLAYLRVLVNPADDVSLLRIINTPPRGIGATTIRRLVTQAENASVRLTDVIARGGDQADLGRAASKIETFRQLLRSLGPVLEMPAPQALENVISLSGLRALYQGEAGPDDEPGANLKELGNAAAQFQAENPGATLVDWLEHAALVSDVDAIRDAEQGCVTLMTLHAAKGLEFRVVYIVGLEEGILPFRRYDDADVDEEEERRLLFVGMTRAKRRLTLSNAKYRMRPGRSERTARSRFVAELPRELLEWVRPAEACPTRTGKPGGGGLPDDIAEWAPGTLVRHPEFGLGQILTLSRSVRRSHAAVAFEDGNKKSFVLEFADLERVDFDDVGSSDW